jgi:hypothetical protein
MNFLPHHPPNTKLFQRSFEVAEDDSVTQALEHETQLENALSLLRMVEVSSELTCQKGLRVSHPRLRTTVGRLAKSGQATPRPMAYEQWAIAGVTRCSGIVLHPSGVGCRWRQHLAGKPDNSESHLQKSCPL